MNLNQCVPCWDLDDVGPNPPPPPPPCVVTACSQPTFLSTCPDTSLQIDYGVAELTWENGQLAMHGLGLPRVSSKPNLGGAWPEKPFTRASGTLESIVNQAITKPQPPPTFHGSACDKDTVVMPFFDQCVGVGVVSGPMASMSMTMDALVPTANVSHNTRVGSCSVEGAARVPVGSEWSVSLSGSMERERLKRPIEDTCEIVGGDLTNGLSSTSFGTSPESTKTVTVDDHDSVCHRRPLIERMHEEVNGNKVSGESSMSTKRIRAAAIHNQSERKRRDKINQKMKTLQKLVPNSSKTDKASMLDEAIDYLKQLQAQVQMMSSMSMPTSMMMQMAAIQQHLQMSMISQMGMGMGMPIGMGHMNMSVNPMALARPSTHGVGHATILNPSNFMSSPLATWDGPSTTTNNIGDGTDRLASQQQVMVSDDPFSTTFFACQSQPKMMDTNSRMAAMYEQLQQQPQEP